MLKVSKNCEWLRKRRKRGLKISHTYIFFLFSFAKNGCKKLQKLIARKSAKLFLLFSSLFFQISFVFLFIFNLLNPAILLFLLFFDNPFFHLENSVDFPARKRKKENYRKRMISDYFLEIMLWVIKTVCTLDCQKIFNIFVPNWQSNQCPKDWAWNRFLLQLELFIRRL